VFCKFEFAVKNFYVDINNTISVVSSSSQKRLFVWTHSV